MLTATQARFLQEMLSAPTIEKAAANAGISSRTAYAYRQLPEFRTAYERACADVLKSAAQEMQRKMTAAVDVLVAIMSDETAENADRIRAARAIITDGMKLTETADFERRLEALEDAANVDR